MTTKLYSPTELMSYFISPFEVLTKKALKENKNLKIKQDLDDPLLKLIAEKGIDHEIKLLKKLKTKYDNTVTIKNDKPEIMIAATVSAMESGADLIYQAALSNDQFFGKPDFLIKIDGSSKFGDYQYKVLDAKLAKHLKPEYIIQLCCYSELLEHTQGNIFEVAQIYLGNDSYEDIKINDFYVFYQKIKDEFIKDMQSVASAPPSPDHFTQWGAFSEYAESYFQEHDHLIQLPDIRQSQIKKLHQAKIMTINNLFDTSIDRVSGMDHHVFKRLKNQAEMHVKTLNAGSIQYKVLDDC